MKNKKYLILVFVLVFATSCKKQLNTVPTDFITPVNYYTDANQLNKGLAGVYDILGDGATYGEELLSYMSYTNDEGIFIWAGTLIPPSNFSYASNEPTITSMWNALYRGIQNANLLLEAVDSKNANGVAQSVRDNIRAQAIFLRAYYYFMLVDRWGAIPMPLSSTKTSDNVNLASTPVAEVYAQIIKDMTAAEAVLPYASTLGLNSSGRLSKNTAQGMLARVCLSMTGFPLNDESKYANAKAWCDSVIDRGENVLDPSYSDLFVKEARDEYYVKENLWEVEFYGNYLDLHREGGYNGIRNGLLGNWGQVFPGYSYNFLQASIVLYNKYQQDPITFLSKDLRRARNIPTFQWSGRDVSQIMAKNYWPLNGNLYERWPGKWRRDEEINLPRFKNANGTNFPLLRYSDVLLMFAEAENHINGPTPAAYNAINQVRERAYGTGYRVSAITLTNGGSGYPTQVPTAAIPIFVNVNIGTSGDPNGASTAEAYSTITGGKVTAITLVAMGAFYGATPPAVTITSSNGLGTGATATATVTPINVNEADLAPGLSKDQFFQEIMDERPRELAYECLRSHDLRRWGLLISTINNLATYGAAAPVGTVSPIALGYLLPAAYITTKNLYYPIPPSEIATNALIKQNPGW